jgi:hypothetical protein
MVVPAAVAVHLLAEQIFVVDLALLVKDTLVALVELLKAQMKMARVAVVALEQ